MTTQREKIQKLRALARSPNQHEAALARAKAEELESRHVTAKTLAHAIAQLLEGRGMVVRVKHRYAREVNRHQDLPSHKTKIDADIRYFKSQSRALHHEIGIEVIEYE
jgi:hypothetical protein